MVAVGYNHLIGSDSGVLADGQLDPEGRKADDEEHEYVRDEEAAPAVHVGHIRESPHVAQANGQAQAGEEELAVVSPTLSVLGPGHRDDCLSWIIC